MESLGLRIGAIAQVQAHNYAVKTYPEGRMNPVVLELVKDVYMYEIVYAKFDQNQDIRQELLLTKDAYVAEDATGDPYWGWGSDHRGKNKLGRILMMVRHALETGSGKPFGYANPRTASLT
jgi:hypothetical protein